VSDPDTYPTPEDDYDYYSYDDQAEDDDQAEGEHEWQPGECDHCYGLSAEDVERGTSVFPAPVCACSIGQGAPADQCRCGGRKTVNQ
jgi:hypothetical protein